MDFLTGEINKLKRKAPVEADKKYIKRSDLEALRQAEYKTQQEELKASRQTKEAEKLQRIAEHESAKRQKSSIKASKDHEQEQKQATVDIDQIRAELKSLHQPIQLFGEEPAEVKKRLLQYKARQEQLANSTSAILREVYTDPRDDTLPLNDQEITIDASLLKSTEEHKRSELHSSIFLLMRIYIKEWDNRIRAPDSDADEQQLATQVQAKEHLSRLLIRLKTSNLPPDILTNLTHVALGLQERDYNAANRAYLQMSIGKATWPVGVTSVGIHERAQREREHKKLDSAHILADETTRQWLQSLKRLVTYREKTFTEKG